MSVIHIKNQKELDDFGSIIQKDLLVIINSEEILKFRKSFVCFGGLNIISEVESNSDVSHYINISVDGGDIRIYSKSRIRIDCRNKSTIYLQECKDINVILSSDEIAYINALKVDKLFINSGSAIRCQAFITLSEVVYAKIEAMHDDKYIVNLTNSKADIASYNDSIIKIQSGGKSIINSLLRDYSTQFANNSLNSQHTINAFDISTVRLATPYKNYKISLYDNSRLIGNIKNIFEKSSVIPFQSKTAQLIQDGIEEKSVFFEKYNLHGKVVDDKIILYKRVSYDFKTQENTNNETKWIIGEYIEHHDWHPALEECGAYKFHACVLPFMCDMFRKHNSDRYIAIEMNVSDLYDWPKEKTYPYKIAFRAGTVLYECDWLGNKIENVESEVAV